MPQTFFPGAARAFTEAQLGGPCTLIPSNPTSTTGVTKFLNNSPDRVALVVVNLGANNVFININSGVSATNGVELTANGGSATLTVRDDFELVASEWWTTATGGSSALLVLEVVRQIYTPAAEKP